MVELEVESIPQDAVLLEEQGDDGLHALMLENTLIDALAEVRQTRHKADLIMRSPMIGVSLAYPKDLAVNAGLARIKA